MIQEANQFNQRIRKRKRKKSQKRRKLEPKMERHLNSQNEKVKLLVEQDQVDLQFLLNQLNIHKH